MKEESILTGLVTVLYKSDDVLDVFLKSIFRQTFKNYILYLVDNSANEISTKLIEDLLKKYPVCKSVYIKSESNIGVAAGNNRGLRAALKDNCSHVLFLNNDIEIESDTLLENMLTLAISKPEMIIVPKILYYDSRKIWMAGGYMDLKRALGVHYGMDKEDAPEFNKPKYITYAPTCFMLVHKSVFDKVGQMDELYFAYYDDTDFVLRAIQSGYKMWYQPDLCILHKVSSSSGTNSPFYVYYSNRNKIYFINKHLKGLIRYFALSYTLIVRILFWLKFDKERKVKLIQGLKDGFKISKSLKK